MVNKTLNNQELELGSLADMLGVELRKSLLLAEKYFTEHCPVNILPGHFTILKLIQNNPGQNQTALAKAALIDRSTMVPIIDQFEKNSWVVREQSAGDRRAYALKLTQKGADLISELDSFVLDLEKKISKSLGKQNRQQLLKLLCSFQHVF
jgi:DNA-binding MarR family transcriptional regulator